MLKHVPLCFAAAVASVPTGLAAGNGLSFSQFDFGSLGSLSDTLVSGDFTVALNNGAGGLVLTPDGVDFTDGLSPDDFMTATYGGSDMTGLNFAFSLVATNTGLVNPPIEGLISRDAPGLNAGDFSLHFRPVDGAGVVGTDVFEPRGLLELIFETDTGTIVLTSTDLAGAAGVYDIDEELSISVNWSSSGIALVVNGDVVAQDATFTDGFNLAAGDVFRLGGQTAVDFIPGVTDPVDAGYSGVISSLEIFVPTPAAAGLFAAGGLVIRGRRR